MRRIGSVLVALGLMLGPVLAQDADAFSDALAKAIAGIAMADAYMAACDEHDPDSRQARQDAMAGWSHRVDRAGYDRFIISSKTVLPDLSASITKHEGDLRKAVRAEIGKQPGVCATFSDKLDEDVLDIEGSISHLLYAADDFGITVPEAPKPQKGEDIHIYPLVALSARLEAVMGEIGSREGAASDSDLRKAREEHAEAFLQQDLAVAVLGRVTAEDEMREWRGDQQSSFLVDCTSFADDEAEAAMKAGLGQDRVVAGQIDWVSAYDDDGVIALDDCHVFTGQPAKEELVSLPDESAGLMLRPPEYDEIFAGPGAGIGVGDVDRVLYDAQFNTGIDGFGNSYTNRNENIYVLLRDGTAYRHDWNFSFTDLDVTLSKAREPDRWFTWSDNGGKVILTQSGGFEVGDERDVSSAQRLMPVPNGQRLDRTYYFLNVGMGGVRSDRDYAFSADGQLKYTRGGFVAGNFGTSYITVVSDNDHATTSAYAFDGYTMLLDGPQGQERHFAAVFDGDGASEPEQMIIDGQVYWLREKGE